MRNSVCPLRQWISPIDLTEAKVNCCSSIADIPNILVDGMVKFVGLAIAKDKVQTMSSETDHAI